MSKTRMEAESVSEFLARVAEARDIESGEELTVDYSKYSEVPQNDVKNSYNR